MESALQGMSQANMDLGILQETKITNGVYTRGSAGYKVIATDAPIRHRSGVALFYRLTPHFVVEAVERCGPNVMVCQVATGERRWHIVGAYIAPEDELRFGTYNIRNGRKGGMESELQGMSQANMDQGILQEMNLTDGVYTHGSTGYKVIATDASS